MLKSQSTLNSKKSQNRLSQTLKESFVFFQKIGKSLMLPVSVLPIAGILLGVGSAHFSWMPDSLSILMAQAGGAIFGTLPLIFAIAVALGFAANDGVAALAATVGFVVLTATLGVMATLFGIETKEIMGMKSIDTGVFGGILMGGVAAYLFKRFYRIQLPAYLGFFAGKRFVPIITALSAILMGLILSFIWPPIQQQINLFSHFAAYKNPTLAATTYGVVERILIPFGLHHIWNVPFFFEIGSFTDKAGTVVHGDINRFFAGDPTAGILGGAYLFKMWGLPAAAFAIWHCANPEQKSKTGSIMISAALTSFLTGITEPLEFSFLFVAPLLYGVHALLVGVGQALFGLFGAKLGFTFSQGFIDYILYYSLDTKPWLVLLVGPLFGLLYYGIFRGLIVAFDLKTPGREIISGMELSPLGSPATAAAAARPGNSEEMAIALIQAFGGKNNIQSLDACITRLRVELKNIDLVNTHRLKSLGAAGVLSVGQGIQAIFGPASENLKTDMEAVLENPALIPPDSLLAAKNLEPFPNQFEQSKDNLQPLAHDPDLLTDPEMTRKVGPWIEKLGGALNIVSIQPCALTRIRIILKDQAQIDSKALLTLGVQRVIHIEGQTFHLIVGLSASLYAKALRTVHLPA